MAKLEIANIWKTFDNTGALCDVSFSVASGEIVCLLGPSGCGKTTLLRIVAGLEVPDSGRVLVDGEDVAPVPPHQRDFGLMFQDYALFPHKNVFENVAFGLRMQHGASGHTEERIAARVHQVLDLVGLRGFERRAVDELSGGEAQRVALARSLAPRPRLLMLDEPLGSLDRATRERLMVELRDILSGVGVTALYVTHDQTEAFSVADRAIIMNVGRIEQAGLPESIYRHPATAFVARFLGMTNLSPGRVLRTGQVESAWGTLEATTDRYGAQDEVRVLIRSEAVTLVSGSSSDMGDEPRIPTQHTILRGRLASVTFRGAHYQVRLDPDVGPRLTFELSAVQPMSAKPGDSVAVVINAAGVVLLPPQDEDNTPSCRQAMP